jgi:hypothetical protein
MIWLISAIDGIFTESPATKPCFRNSPINNLQGKEYKIKFIAVNAGSLLTLGLLEKTPRKVKKEFYPQEVVTSTTTQKKKSVMLNNQIIKTSSLFSISHYFLKDKKTKIKIVFLYKIA